MLSNVTYAAMKINPDAGMLVSHSNGFVQAVTIPNQEILFLKPALEQGYLYTFSAKLSKLGGFNRLDDGKIVYNNPVEFRIHVDDDLQVIAENLRNQWYKAWEALSNKSQTE